MYIKYNMNPCDKRTIDCTVRALATLFDEQWDRIYIRLCIKGLNMCDMPSSKAVIDSFLWDAGYIRRIPPKGTTIEEFTKRHKNGKYLLATNSHVVPAMFGNYVDTWDSGREIVLFYWEELNDKRI